MWKEDEEFDRLIDHEGLASGRDLFRPEAAKRMGVPSFSFAETDFRIPAHMQRAFHTLIDRGFCGYTVAEDETYLRAIVDWMRVRRGWEVRTEWILPVYGVLRTMSMAVRAFSCPGEGVLLFSPGYTAYEGLIAKNGRRIVRIPLHEEAGRFLPNFSMLEAQMRRAENTMLFLCNAHNPTMQVWPQALLEQIAAWAAAYGVFVVVDETFADLCFPKTPMTNYGQIAAAEDNCLVIQAISKAFNVTGLNAANAILPGAAARERFRQTFLAEQRGSGSIEPFVRTAILAGYSPEGAAWLERLFIYVRQNMDLVRRFFWEVLPQVRLFPCDCAYLVWTDWRALGLSDVELECFLFDEAVFCVDMGQKYGPEGSGFARIHLGTSHKNLLDGLLRLQAAAHARGFCAAEPFSADGIFLQGSQKKD